MAYNPSLLTPMNEPAPPHDCINAAPQANYMQTPLGSNPDYDKKILESAKAQMQAEKASQDKNWVGGGAAQQSSDNNLVGDSTAGTLGSGTVSGGLGGYYPPVPQTPCPYCGYCPHCGRGGYTPPQPYNPSYPANPIWTLTCGPVGTAQNFS